MKTNLVSTIILFTFSLFTFLPVNGDNTVNNTELVAYYPFDGNAQDKGNR